MCELYYSTLMRAGLSVCSTPRGLYHSSSEDLTVTLEWSQDNRPIWTLTHLVSSLSLYSLQFIVYMTSGRKNKERSTRCCSFDAILKLWFTLWIIVHQYVVCGCGLLKCNELKSCPELSDTFQKGTKYLLKFIQSLWHQRVAGKERHQEHDWSCRKSIEVSVD